MLRNGTNTTNCVEIGTWKRQREIEKVEQISVFAYTIRLGRQIHKRIVFVR